MTVYLLSKALVEMPCGMKDLSGDRIESDIIGYLPLFKTKATAEKYNTLGYHTIIDVEFNEELSITMGED